jgi:hypothetical protein
MKTCGLVVLAFFTCFPALPRTLYNSSADSSFRSWDPLRGKASRDETVARENHPSLRVESNNGSDAYVVSEPLQLVIGKRYALSGWIKTDSLRVSDSGRTPIAVGAALSMASMPWDMHSASVGATRDWTRVQLEFTATRERDNIVLNVAKTGSFQGTAWFQGVSLDDASAKSGLPKLASVRTLGPAYRYPSGGWIYLHIEGKPYDRGYQHGFLMANEITSYMARCAASFQGDAKQAWDQGRTMTSALFLRGYDQEILEEMRGIADGANAAGAKFEDRPLDLLDIVTINSSTEIGDLRAALPLTPTGLEGLTFQAPNWKQPVRGGPSTNGLVPPNARCSAFAATGKATRDGKMVIGHLTMWSLTLAEQVNVMLDVKPVTGHRVLIQSYPGGIQSGMDWYQNDAGVVLTETTIRQSPFDVNGTPEAYRARHAIQYGGSVPEVAKDLVEHNNGLYTNEWLIGDAKTNEIGMLELGTHRTKFYQSSKNEWFGGTQGFYWGCNNAKDLNVRLEYVPDPKGKPEDLSFSPSPRDVKWLELFNRYKGQIDEQFGFLAFRTAPLVSSTTFDAKVTNSDLASRQMLWAVFGKPNEREWVPSEFQKKNYAGNEGIYSSGYRVFNAAATDGLVGEIAGHASTTTSPEKKQKPQSIDADKLWKGWIVPATTADTWLTAGSALYYKALTSENPDKTVESYRTQLRGLELTHDRPLLQMNGDLSSTAWASVTEFKGALFLAALRKEMGDDEFLHLMNKFFETHTTKTVTTAEFLNALEQTWTKPHDELVTTWLKRPGLPGAGNGPLYVARLSQEDLANTVIVYGTVTEAGANRYAAERLQAQFLDALETRVPVLRDYEVTPDQLRSRNVVFVGRPETNSMLASWADRLDLHFDGNTFGVRGVEHGSENDSLLYAAANPMDRTHKVLVLAGNSAIATVRLSAPTPRSREMAQYAVYDHGKFVDSGFLE